MKNKNLTICISGTPSPAGTCGVDALEVARTLGREMAERKIIVTATSTTGFPLWTALGATGEGGTAIAFSPAASEREHMTVHKLPLDGFTMMVYTGFGPTGAGILAMRSSDAVIFGCGGMTTVLETTTAIYENKPIGILEGSWKTDEVIRELLNEHYPDYDNIVVDSDPRRLLDQLAKRVRMQKDTA